MNQKNEQSKEIHLPSPSYWPIVLAIGLGLICLGIILNPIISVIGLVILLTAIAGWTLENRAENMHHQEDQHD